MDPELQRIHDNIRRIIDAGGPESDILAYLRTEGFESRDEWIKAWAPPPPVNTGPTPPLPFNTLPPAMGGALDALVAYGSGTGLPLLSEDTREYVSGLRERNPGTTTAVQAAGAATGLAALGGAARYGTGPILHTAPRGAFARGAQQAAPSITQKARDLLLRRLLPGGLAADYLWNRITGR